LEERVEQKAVDDVAGAVPVGQHLALFGSDLAPKFHRTATADWRAAHPTHDQESRDQSRGKDEERPLPQGGRHAEGLADGSGLPNICAAPTFVLMLQSC